MDILELLDEKENINLAPAPRLAHFLNLGLNLDTKTIHLNSDIAPDTGEWVWTLLDYWADEEVQLHLSTDGGDVGSMFEIESAIKRHGNVTITGYGLIASAGVLILAAGQRRKVTRTLCVMSHESAGFGGDVGYRAAKDRRKYEEWQHQAWCALMAEYTNKDAAWWDKVTMEKGELWLLGGKKVVELGIADEVI